MYSPSLAEIDRIRKNGYRPQVVGCFMNSQRILFLYDKKYGLWQLPQGGIDNKETVEQAVLREMSEELGEEFTAPAEIKALLGEDQLEFPDRFKNSREMRTDDGEEMNMRGKKYFFVAIDTDLSNLDIDKTEFDDYKWLDYEGALRLTAAIHQKGKRIITESALAKLRESGLLS